MYEDGQTREGTPIWKTTTYAAIVAIAVLSVVLETTTIRSMADTRRP